MQLTMMLLFAIQRLLLTASHLLKPILINIAICDTNSNPLRDMLLPETKYGHTQVCVSDDYVYILYILGTVDSHSIIPLVKNCPTYEISRLKDPFFLSSSL